MRSTRSEPPSADKDWRRSVKRLTCLFPSHYRVGFWSHSRTQDVAKPKVQEWRLVGCRIEQRTDVPPLEGSSGNVWKWKNGRGEGGYVLRRSGNTHVRVRRLHATSLPSWCSIDFLKMEEEEEELAADTEQRCRGWTGRRSKALQEVEWNCEATGLKRKECGGGDFYFVLS